MPVYLLSVCYPADATPPTVEALDVIMRNVEAVREEMKSDGVWVFGGGLADPSTATTVREHDGEVALIDGPFIESKEQIGGLTIIEARDLDEAIAWARRQSHATTTPIEVRPFVGASA